MLHTKRINRALAAFVLLMISLATPFGARAQFGGAQIVFEPQMFARQLQQLQQETASVTNLAQQLQLMIQNTTGGSAGVWTSNQNLLTNLGELINQQEGLSYSATSFRFGCSFLASLSGLVMAGVGRGQPFWGLRADLTHLTQLTLQTQLPNCKQ